jgi:hypothetical protein
VCKTRKSYTLLNTLFHLPPLSMRAGQASRAEEAFQAGEPAFGQEASAEGAAAKGPRRR